MPLISSLCLTGMHACAAQVDNAFKCSDREAVEMAAHLLRCDGLFMGSSAAVNCVGAVKAARALGPGHTVVTVCVCALVEQFAPGFAIPCQFCGACTASRAGLRTVDLRCSTQAQ